MLFSLVLLLVSSPCGAYVDDVPDPDFAPTQTVPIVRSKILQEENIDACNEGSQKLPGYFKLMVKEILRRDILGEKEKAMLQNADSIDPQSLVKIILGLIPEGENDSIAYEKLKASVQYIPEFKNHELAIGYVLAMFLTSYFSKSCRHFIIVMHSVLLYIGAVYSKINKQFGEIIGTKMAASTGIPSHCKEEFSVVSLFSYGWSKLQIGDQCKRYYREVMSDPLYEIDYLKCIFYPFVSVFSVPLAVLGEELGPFLENILLPFPFHLQIFILAFVSVIFGILARILWTLKQSAPPLEDKKLLKQEAETKDRLLHTLKNMELEIKELKDTKRLLSEENRKCKEITRESDTDIDILNEGQPEEREGDLAIEERPWGPSSI